MSKLPVSLGYTQITLLIPLLGRAEETRKNRGLIADPKAVDIVDSLDYDFSKWKGKPSLSGSVLRTRMFDSLVRKFIEENPSGTVVEIGAGLNGRFERVDNGSVHWFDIDLPDVIELRRHYFKDSVRQTMIAGNFIDSDWHDVVRASPGPYCFVAEASIIYIENELVEPAIKRLADVFEGGWLITDTTSQKMVDQQERHDAMKHLPKSSWFRWVCESPTNLRDIGLKLISSQTFVDADEDIRKDLPWFYRIVLKCGSWLLRRKIDGYRINRFRLGQATAIS